MQIENIPNNLIKEIKTFDELWGLEEQNYNNACIHDTWYNQSLEMLIDAILVILTDGVYVSLYKISYQMFKDHFEHFDEKYSIGFTGMNLYALTKEEAKQKENK